MFWQPKITSVLLLLFVSLPSIAREDYKASLKEALNAYTESKSVGNKADTFLHAQRAYKFGLKLYANDPAKLAPIIFVYANAAATYREPIALTIYQQALEQYAKAFGPEHFELTHPLINAAEEAILRKEPEMAYAWLAKARKLIEHGKLKHSFIEARMHMGLARMFKNSGQMDRAENHASRSLDLLGEQDTASSFPENANLHFWHGQIMRSLKQNTQARQSYLKSLELFDQQAPDARKVLSIHTHLVEINHKLNDPDALVFHCKAAAQYQHKRSGGYWFPIYDPTGKLNPIHQGKQSLKTGEIVASYYRTADCRLRDINILGTAGISKADAKLILSGAYFAPQYRNRKIVERRTDQVILPIYR